MGSLPFNTVPLVGYSLYTGGGKTGYPSDPKYYLRITSATVTNRNEDLTYTVSSSNTNVVAATLPTDYPEQLLLTPKGAGTATITVTAKDQYGNTTDTTFQVTVPATATSFGVVAPTNATPGTSFTFTVTAEDQFGHTDPNYTGTVKFTSTDTASSGVSLPSNYTFTAADAGVHTFNATLVTAGAKTITAADTTQTSITGTSNSITVS
jgi:FKBP-type peptidyl-prolyl cis-trans isomerase 2